MKTFKITFFVLLAICCNTYFAHSQAKEATLDFKNYEANITILKNYVAAMKAGDAAKMNALFTDTATIVGLGSTMDTISKSDHLARYTESFKVNTMNISEDVYLSVKTNDQAAVPPGEYGFSWGTVMITNKKSKQTASSRYHVVAIIENGKISFLGHYYDSIPFLLQQGYTITPPKE